MKSCSYAFLTHFEVSLLPSTAGVSTVGDGAHRGDFVLSCGYLGVFAYNLPVVGSSRGSDGTLVSVCALQG
jgi:hypothetical protein